MSTVPGSGALSAAELELIAQLADSHERPVESLSVIELGHGLIRALFSFRTYSRHQPGRDPYELVTIVTPRPELPVLAPADALQIARGETPSPYAPGTPEPTVVDRRPLAHRPEGW